MNPHPHSTSSIIDYFGFPEPIRAQLIQEYPQMLIESEDELFAFVRKVAEQGRSLEKGEALIDDIEERVNLIQHKLKFIEDGKKPSVLILSSAVPPVFEESEYLARLLRMTAAKMYRADTEEVDFNPGVILLISDHMEQQFANLATLLSLEEWKETDAVKQNRVFLIDGSRGFQNMGIRLAADLETLAEIIYPQYLTFGGNGETWLQFDV